MAPHGPLPNPDTLRYLLQRALDKVGSVNQLAHLLRLQPADIQRYIDGELPISDRIFLKLVDILYESEADIAKRNRPPAE